jgi:leucyl-tRNA---protein transferase
MHAEAIRLLKTLEHACGYYGDRVAQNLVVDPLARGLPQIYEAALAHGYRRAGGHIYRPACPRCRACTPARVVVDAFRPDRSMRRCLARNADLELADADATFTDEYFDLYRRYLAARHPGGGMDDADREDFSRFLTSPWSPTRFLCFRRAGRLLAVAVTDFAAAGISSVYTFYEPDEPARSLGVFAILEQIARARALGLPHVYLGYWIAGHPKMGYKERFRPLEVLRGQRWDPLGAAPPRPAR